MSKFSSLRFASRRGFLLSGCAAGGVGLAAVLARFRKRTPAENAFANDLTTFSKLDPKLLQYDQTAKFKPARPETRRIGLSGNGSLLLAAGNYVSTLDVSGVLLRELALPETVRCVASAADGTLFVGLRDRIEVFAENGRRSSWVSPGKRSWFTGLAAGDNDLFVADAGERVVLRFDRTGKFVGKIGEKDPSRHRPGFVVPSPYFDVELHQDGLLRVTNPGRHQIETYTVDGELEQAWGRASAAIDAFCGCCNPINIALFSDGRVVTCEKGVPRVKVYQAAGQLESVVAGPESFLENSTASHRDDSVGGLDAVVDRTGRIFVLDLVANTVALFEKKNS